MSTSSAIVQNSYSYLMTYQNHSEEVFSDAINTENVVFVSGTLPAAAVCPHVHLYFVLLQMLLSLTLRLKKKKSVLNLFRLIPGRQVPEESLNLGISMSLPAPLKLRVIERNAKSGLICTWSCFCNQLAFERFVASVP